MYFVPSHYFPHCLWSYFDFCKAMGFKRPNSSSALVLNAKGGEIKAKAIGLATTCVFFKNISMRILGFRSKPSYCKNCSFMGGGNLIMGKG
jgi:hypothetical protein